MKSSDLCSLKPRGVTLYRCNCKYCDMAEEDLSRLSSHFKVAMTIKEVEKEPGMARCAGWSTPIVYVDGQFVSHYALSVPKWKKAIRDSAARPLIGEVRT